MHSQSTGDVILGIGNPALSDDVAGLKVIRHIVRNHPDLPFQVIEAGSLNYQASDILENARNLVVVEAACLGQSPGTLSIFTGADMDRVLKRHGRNCNETALAELLEIARLAHRLPRNRVLITIEPKKVSWGNRISANVSKAVPKLAQEALMIMSHWTGVGLVDAEPATTEPPLSPPVGKAHS